MQTSAAFIASVLVLGALTPLACTQDFGIFEPSGASSSGTGGTSVTTTTSTGGTGGATECVAGDACSDQNPCTTDKCDTASGKCDHDPVADGPSAGAMNTLKDCRAPECVGGALMQVPSNADVPDDGNVCTADTCDNGTPKITNLSTTTSCGANLYCDGKGACVGCTNANQCDDPGECKFATCENTQCKTNNTPADDGCAGNNICDGKGNCVECLMANDCSGGQICVNNGCTTSCSTGVKDGSETDVDCGGSCPNCAVGKMCKGNGDCTTNLCTTLVCTAMPTCNDGVKNGTESDIDCGGSCLDCAVGKTCGGPNDCVSGICTGGLCAASAPTCTDAMMNGTETDIDCGGPACGPCGNTKKCVAGTDCLSLSCVTTSCAPTQCSDGAKNGTETAVDCGGSCTKCILGKACLNDGDCLSGNCTQGTKICAP